MNFLGWLLTKIAYAFWWLWDIVVDVAGPVFAVLDALVNPVVSPLLRVVNPICTWIGDAVYAALSPLPVWLGLSLLSAVAGVVLLVAFGWLSNQDAIGRAKDDIKSNLLALKLFKDEIRVTFAAQWRLLGAILRLQRYMLLPVFILALPMVPALAQMGVRYQWRPLHVGERCIVSLKLAKAFAKGAKVEIVDAEGFVVEAGVPGGGEVAWRIRATEPGRHTVSFEVQGETVTKELVVGDTLERVSALRPSAAWTSQALHPVESPMSGSKAVESIEVHYPARESIVYGADYWVLTFFVISMVVAIVCKPVFNVKF